MNPNEFQPQQQPGVPPQPQQPNVQEGGQPQVMQPQVGPYGPQPTMSPQQPMQPYPPTQNTRQRTGYKLLVIATVIGLVAVLIAVALLIVVHFWAHKTKSDLNKLNNSLNSTPASSGSSGSSSGSSAASTSKSACDLFTLTDAQAIMGSSAAAGSPLPPADLDGSNSIETDCNYNGQGNIASIQIVVDVSNNASDASNAYSSLSEPQAAPVSGVGDKASWDNNVGLTVQKGNTVINVGTSDQNDNDSQSVDTQVANTILANL